MVNNNNYESWKNSINNNPIVKKNNDVLINKNELKKISTKQRSFLENFRDIILILLVFLFVLLFAVRILYPDQYRDLINNECNPNINWTLEGDLNNINNNATCICENKCEIPDEIKIIQSNYT